MIYEYGDEKNRLEKELNVYIGKNTANDCLLEASKTSILSLICFFIFIYLLIISPVKITILFT